MNAKELKGFLYKVCGRYIFAITDRVHKTESFARKIAKAAGLPETEGYLRNVIACTVPATAIDTGNEYRITGGYFDNVIFTPSEMTIIYA